MIAALYLAAGLGRRFGGDKLLHEVGGMPLFSHGLHHCLASSLPDIRVVIGPRPSKIEDIIRGHHPDDPRISFVVNDDPSRGLVSSLRVGIRSLRGVCDGAMVVLADMPLVTGQIIDALIERFEKTNGIVIPESSGELRHPRVIPARYFDEIIQLSDGGSGADVIGAHADEIVRVHVGNPANYVDIDHPDDLQSV
jgi:molybdenum cofactor cytidylyltransferase